MTKDELNEKSSDCLLLYNFISRIIDVRKMTLRQQIIYEHGRLSGEIDAYANLSELSND